MTLSRRRLIVASGALAGSAIAADLWAESDADASPPGPRPRGVWLAGDTHVHCDHSADGSLPRQQSGQRLPGNLPVRDQIGRAEQADLDFLPLTDHRTYDQHWDPQWTSDRVLLIPGEEANGSPHAVVLGAVDTIVDGANPPGSAAFRHVQQSIWDAHAQDAIWSIAHPDNGEVDADGRPNANASVQGADVVEVWNPASDPDAQIDFAEDRWNKGFRFGAVAASDNHFREYWEIQGPGHFTTWVFAEEATERAILDALRAGRTTVSRTKAGPFVTLEADLDGDGDFEAMGGDEVVLRGRRPRDEARLRIRVRGGAGATLYVFAAPGRSAGPIATLRPQSADETFLVPITPRDGWYRAELRAPGDPSGIGADPTLPDQLRAATSPVFVSDKAPASPAPEIPLPPMLSHEDNARSIVEGGRGFAGFADVAVTGSAVHVVAEVHRHGRVFVEYRRSDSDDAVQLSTHGRVARSPRVAAAGRHVWVAWQEETSDRPRRSVIMLRHSSDGGKRFSSPIPSGGTGRAVHPAIAVRGDGTPVLAWAANGDGPFDVYVSAGTDPVNLSAPGKVVDPGHAGDARSPRYPASLYPAVAVSGERTLVAWQDNRFDPDPLWTGHTPPPGQAPSGNTDPDDWEILASIGLAGRPWTEPVRVSATTGAADRHPSAAADRTGAFHVMWETKALASSGVNLSLRASRQLGDGNGDWSAAEAVGLEPTAMSQRPRLGRDPDGAVRAVWYDSRSADWRWRVFTSRFDEASGWSAAVRVSGAGNGTWPAVDSGVVVFTCDRHARRVQRDPRHDVLLVAIR